MLALLSLAGCGSDTPQALGTIERDRITLPAQVSERIVEVKVREGQPVKAGEVLLRLDRTRTRAQLEVARAQARQAAQALAELQAGPHGEEIARARAALSAAEAQAADADAYRRRLAPLGERRLVSAAKVDRADAAASSARAQVESARQALLELERGTRGEQLAQAAAALSAAESHVADLAALLEELDVTAPRDGLVDSLPYRLGDRAPVGEPLAVLLTGDAPHARVYVPEPLRARIAVGQAARVRVEGIDTGYPGRVRMIRSEPAFTPYYALTGRDAARLSYLAEVELDASVAALPVGLPARVEFDAAD
ncbi:HlyD family efflux transporter periplasmic adaptor subunit [Pseudoxanthomonas sp. J35]|uniref:HlyD family secretion protein n=1 Tax=Pseudoxanthomonas sp. J35 TaxID=935852 RepID=UPI0006855B7E|nr:HlyD family efflux transporter periplasmic adaptor subunit [Pseudoxanthomonas sp. J35]